jgi:hypothetical protein
MYVGSYTDDYYTGSLVTRYTGGDNQQSLLLGVRERMFSKMMVTQEEYPTAIRQSEQSQPWCERAGMVHVIDAVSQDERFYDSLMPSIADIMKTDGGAIAVADGTSFFMYNTPPTMDTNNVGFVFFSSRTFIAGEQPDLDKINDWYWNCAFPFEPRYSQIVRQQRVQDGYDATYSFNLTAAGGVTTTSIPKTKVNGLYVTNMYQTPTGLGLKFLCDFFFDGRVLSTSSILNDDALRALYGFGDRITGFNLANRSESHKYTPRDYSNAVITGQTVFWEVGPQIRGWKYGVYSGLPSYSKSYWRRGSYGQFRDMLEQRQFSKFFDTSNKNANILSAPVKVRFVDSTGKTTSPELTWSQNLSNEATSSVPYFDGETRNRNAINLPTLNQNILSLNSDIFNNVTL